MTDDELSGRQADDFVDWIMKSFGDTGQIPDQYVALAIEQFLITKYEDPETAIESCKEQFQAFAQPLIPVIEDMLSRSLAIEHEPTIDEKTELTRKINELIYGDNLKLNWKGEM